MSCVGDVSAGDAGDTGLGQRPEIGPSARRVTTLSNQSATFRHERVSVPKGDVMGPETAMATAGGVIARNGKEVERLRRQVEVMLAYALDKGMTPAPQAWMFDAVREQLSSIDLGGGDGWGTPVQEVDPRATTDALVRAHRELSRLVAPARPATIELLHSYREGRRAPRVRIPRQQGRPGTPGAGLAAPKLQWRRPRVPGIGSTVPLVRWLMIATMVFLVLFVLFAASPDAREAITGDASGVSMTTDDGDDGGSAKRPDRRPIGDDGVTQSYQPAMYGPRLLGGSGVVRSASEPALGGVSVDASFTRLLLRELFLLCAAGLGACLTALYRASREVARGTYDPEFDHTFLQRVVLGMATGLILAELLPIGNGSSPLVLPAVALVGGFAASVVQRLLSRVVAALEALFSGDPDEQEDSRRELAQKRADEVLAQAERANLATLLEIRRIASSGAPARAVIDEIDRVIVQVSPS
jgi:hypothetical protein